VSDANREKLEAAEALLLEVRESLKRELWGRDDSGTEDAIRTLATVVVQVGRILDEAAVAGEVTP
jgi:ribosomal protein S11